MPLFLYMTSTLYDTILKSSLNFSTTSINPNIAARSDAESPADLPSLSSEVRIASLLVLESQSLTSPFDTLPCRETLPPSLDVADLATDEAHFGGGSTYPRNFFLNLRTRSVHISVNPIVGAFTAKSQSSKRIQSRNWTRTTNHYTRLMQLQHQPPKKCALLRRRTPPTEIHGNTIYICRPSAVCAAAVRDSARSSLF